MTFTLAEKNRTRQRTLFLIRRGKLRRPDNCSRCNEVAPLQAHHTDYTDAFAVVFLCRWCHEAEHHGERSPRKYRITGPQEARDKPLWSECKAKAKMAGIGATALLRALLRGYRDGKIEVEVPRVLVNEPEVK